MKIAASVVARGCSRAARGRHTVAPLNRAISADLPIARLTGPLAMGRLQSEHLMESNTINCQSSSLRAFATAAPLLSPPPFFSRNGTDTRLKKDSDYLLYDIPLGEMVFQDRSLAHRVMVAWQRTDSIDGAHIVQQILERLTEEEEAGNYKVADITARLYSIAIKAWANSGDKQCGQRAEAILNRMQERYTKYSEFKGSSSSSAGASHDFEKARPDNRCFNLTLHALAQSHEPDATIRAEKLVQQMEDLSAKDSNSKVSPQTATYNSLMNCYASRIGEYGTGQRAEDILLEMSAKNRDGNFAIHPDTLSFNIVLKAWLHSGECGYESANRAEQLLRLMAKLQDDGLDYVRPDAISFLTVLQAYARANSDADSQNVVERVEGLIDLMEETGASGDDVTRCFNTALVIIAKSGVDNASQKSELLIDRMDKLQKSGTLHLQPACFQSKVSILDATGRGGEYAAKEAERLLNGMIKDSLQANSIDNKQRKDLLVNDSIACGTLLKIVLESGVSDSIKRADNIIASMEEASKQVPICAPYKSHYNIVIDAYSKSHEKTAPLDAFTLLQRQEQCFAAGNKRSQPEGFAYSSVIGQLARSNELGVEEKAYEALMMMNLQAERGNADVIPITVDYNCVIGLLAKARKGRRALSLFRQMEVEAESGNSNLEPDIFTLSSVVSALTRTRDKRAPEIALELLNKANDDGGISVDAVFLRQIIRALCQSRKLELVDKALEILTQATVANEQEEDSGTSHDVANTFILNSLVEAHASQGKGTKTATKAQSVLVDFVSQYRNGKISALPDKYGFSAVISAWSYSPDSLAMKHVEKLVHLMSELHSQGCPNLEPDAQTITRALSVYSNFANKDVGAVEKAQKLFDQITYPDEKLYNALLNLIAKSNEPNKHERAKAILQTMKETFSSIDVNTYNVVLNACAFVSRQEDKEGALEIASEIFREMISRNKCDDVSYGTWLKAIKKCLSPEDDKREERIRELVQQCKEGGFFGDLVMKELKYEYGPRLWEVLSVEGENNVSAEWRRNARNPRGRTRKR